MSRLVRLSLVLLGVACPSLLAQQTKTFPAYHCQYTLPGPGWVWKKEPPRKATMMATHPDGLVLGLLCEKHPQNLSELKDEFARGFEKGMVKKGFKKGSAKFLTFKGRRTFQIEGTVGPNQHVIARVFLAHGTVYTLTVAGVGKPIAERPDYEKILDGFAFTREPEPESAPVASNDPGKDFASRAGHAVGSLLGCACILAIPVAVIGGIVFLVVRASKSSAPPRPRRSWDDDDRRRYRDVEDDRDRWSSREEDNHDRRGDGDEDRRRDGFRE